MADNPLIHLLRNLRTHTQVDAHAEAAILSLPYTMKSYEAPAYLIREGSTHFSHCHMIVSGYAFRQKVTEDGSRQIVSLHMRGDLLDLQHVFLGHADHSVQALTALHTVNIDRAALEKLILEEPSVGRAMWIDALVNSSIYREWIVNVGRRDARARVAHLLCEFAVRMRAAGLSDGLTCQLPMTQEQIGDAVGLTSVHVNRTLRALEHEGVITRNKREVSFNDWQTVRRVGEFSAAYLHLEPPESTEFPRVSWSNDARSSVQL